MLGGAGLCSLNCIYWQVPACRQSLRPGGARDWTEAWPWQGTGAVDCRIGAGAARVYRLPTWSAAPAGAGGAAAACGVPWWPTPGRAGRKSTVPGGSGSGHQYCRTVVSEVAGAIAQTTPPFCRFARTIITVRLPAQAAVVPPPFLCSGVHVGDCVRSGPPSTVEAEADRAIAAPHHLRTSASRCAPAL